MSRYRNSPGQYLFQDYDFFSMQEHQGATIKDEIANANPSTIESGSVEEAASFFVNKYAFTIPALTEGAVSVDVEEAQIEVDTNNFYYGFTPGTRSMPGIRATYFVPFQGDKNAFLCRPSTYTTLWPFAEVRDGELRFTFERPDQNVAETKNSFESELANVKQYLGWLRDNATNFNNSLPAIARQAVAARRSRLAKLQQGKDSLGIPIRRAATSPTLPSAVSVASPRPKPADHVVAESKMYDVALSFAGEDRAYVEQVAVGLRATGVEVFYDDFEKANLWGKNLIDHLAKIYQNDSRYVVMFVSEHYIEKGWPQHERQFAQARALVAKEEYILPARFDDTDVPGMTSTVGYVDLRKLSPDQFVELILTKLGRKRS